MDTKSKVIVIVCSVLAVFFLIFYLVLGFFKPDETIEVTFPDGRLSQSVFDLQNMNYVKTEEYTGTHYFRYIPYSVDIVEGARASIGNGVIYDSSPYYFYCSESLLKEDTQEVLKKEITDILSLTAAESDTVVEVLKQEDGYINGCTASFYVLRITAEKEVAYMCLYRMHVNSDIYESDRDIFVGVMSIGENVSTSSLEGLCTLANASAYAMKYSKETEERLLEEKQLQIENGEQTQVDEGVVSETPEVLEATPVPADNANDLFKTP